MLAGAQERTDTSSHFLDRLMKIRVFVTDKDPVKRAAIEALVADTQMAGKVVFERPNLTQFLVEKAAELVIGSNHTAQRPEARTLVAFCGSPLVGTAALLGAAATRALARTLGYHKFEVKFQQEFYGWVAEGAETGLACPVPDYSSNTRLPMADSLTPSYCLGGPRHVGGGGRASSAHIPTKDEKESVGMGRRRSSRFDGSPVLPTTLPRCFEENKVAAVGGQGRVPALPTAPAAQQGDLREPKR